MRRLGGVKSNIAVVHDEDTKTVPRGGKFPFDLQVIVDGQEGSFLLQNFLEGRILLGQNALSFREIPVVGIRVIRHTVDKLVGIVKRLVQFALNGFASNDVEELAQATILIGHIDPAINAINRVKPLGNLQIGVEVLVRLEGRATLRMDGAGVFGPLLGRRRVVVDAANGSCASLIPLLTDMSRDRNVQQPNVGSFHLIRGGPRIWLRGRDRKQLNTAVRSQRMIRKVSREPAVNAIAVEENGGAKVEFVGHGIGSMELDNFIIRVGWLQFFQDSMKKAPPPSSFFIFFFILCVLSF